MAEDDNARDTTILLGVLSAVERDPAVTQRSISSELGIALGLANAYLKRCVRKGWIKVTQAPLNRYAYYLTPHGFAEKSRLTGTYLALSFRFFRDARTSCTAVLKACHGEGLGRIVLAGAGELAEVAVLSAGEAGVQVVAVVDPAAAPGSCAGRPVVASLAAVAEPFDAVVVTDTAASEATFQAMTAAAAGALPAGRVRAPPLLRLPATVGEATAHQAPAAPE